MTKVVKSNAFVSKLYRMLQDPSLQHLIWWTNSKDDNIFALYPDKEFANALTNYFKHGNVASFVRQLHMYGFHKVLDPNLNDKVSQVWEFKHSLGKFKKNDENSLSYIKRRSTSSYQRNNEILEGHLEPRFNYETQNQNLQRNNESYPNPPHNASFGPFNPYPAPIYGFDPQKDNRYDNRDRPFDRIDEVKSDGQRHDRVEIPRHDGRIEGLQRSDGPRHDSRGHDRVYDHKIIQGSPQEYRPNSEFHGRRYGSDVEPPTFRHSSSENQIFRHSSDAETRYKSKIPGLFRHSLDEGPRFGNDSQIPRHNSDSHDPRTRYESFPNLPLPRIDAEKPRELLQSSNLDRKDDKSGITNSPISSYQPYPLHYQHPIHHLPPHLSSFQNQPPHQFPVQPWSQPNRHSYTSNPIQIPSNIPQSVAHGSPSHNYQTNTSNPQASILNMDRSSSSEVKSIHTPQFRKVWESNDSHRPRNPSLLYDPLAPIPNNSNSHQSNSNTSQPTRHLPPFNQVHSASAPSSVSDASKPNGSKVNIDNHSKSIKLPPPSFINRSTSLKDNLDDSSVKKPNFNSSNLFHDTLRPSLIDLHYGSSSGSVSSLANLPNSPLKPVIPRDSFTSSTSNNASIFSNSSSYGSFSSTKRNSSFGSITAPTRHLSNRTELSVTKESFSICPHESLEKHTALDSRASLSTELKHSSSSNPLLKLANKLKSPIPRSSTSVPITSSKYDLHRSLTTSPLTKSKSDERPKNTMVSITSLLDNSSEDKIEESDQKRTRLN